MNRANARWSIIAAKRRDRDNAKALETARFQMEIDKAVIEMAAIRGTLSSYLMPFTFADDEQVH